MRRHRYTAGVCVCGAAQPKPGQRVGTCTRPTQRYLSTGAVKACRVRKALLGLCRDCRVKALPDSAFCEQHRQASLARGRARNRAQGRPVRLSCSCGVPGHYEHTCPTGAAL